MPLVYKIVNRILRIIYTDAMPLDVANRQICSAIRLFFENADAVAVHTLASAARTIYSVQCRISGIPQRSDWVLASGEPELHEQAGFSDEMNDYEIMAACNDCIALSPEKPPVEVQIYSFWFMFVKQNIAFKKQITHKLQCCQDAKEVAIASRLVGKIDELFPDIGSATRDNQKEVGLFLLYNSNFVSEMFIA